MLDLVHGYWQVGLVPDARDKAALVTNSGLYQFTVMPFGLANASLTFEQLWNGFCLAYSGRFI